MPDMKILYISFSPDLGTRWETGKSGAKPRNTGSIWCRPTILCQLGTGLQTIKQCTRFSQIAVDKMRNTYRSLSPRQSGLIGNFIEASRILMESRRPQTSVIYIRHHYLNVCTKSILHSGVSDFSPMSGCLIPGPPLTKEPFRFSVRMGRNLSRGLGLVRRVNWTRRSSYPCRPCFLILL